MKTQSSMYTFHIFISATQIDGLLSTPEVAAYRWKHFFALRPYVTSPFVHGWRAAVKSFSIGPCEEKKTLSADLDGGFWELESSAAGGWHSSPRYQPWRVYDGNWVRWATRKYPDCGLGVGDVLGFLKAPFKSRSQINGRSWLCA